MPTPSLSSVRPLPSWPTSGSFWSTSHTYRSWIRRARENDGDVAVACDRPSLIRLLHTTGFDRIVPVRETIEEAVLALGDPDAV